MKCEIRNTQSSETYQIPPEGSVFGRQGGPANITVADQSVSKRHARIYMEAGRWFLEDLKSVNGTVVDSRRITEPVAIKPGFMFSLSKHQFEVVNIEGDKPARGGGGRQNGGGPSLPSVDNASSASASDPSRRSKSNAPQQGVRPRMPPVPPSQPMQVADMEPMLPPAEQSNLSMQQQGMGGGGDDYMDEMGGEGDGAGAAIGRAFGYYLKNVPLLALNPFGTVRKGIEEQPLPPMQKMPLGFFLVPVYAGAAALMSGAAGLSTIIGSGTGLVEGIKGIATGGIGGLVAAIIGGFIAHPVLKFVVEKIFKGETDDKSRTNAIAMFATATALTMLVGAASTIFGGVVTRLASFTKFAIILNVVPALAAIPVNALVGYIGWQWFKAWRTAKWAQILCIVLIVAGAAFGLLGAVGVVKTTIDAVRGGGGGVVGMSPEDIEKAKKDAEEAAKKAIEAAGGNPDDVKKDDDKKDDDKKDDVKKDDVKKDDDKKDDVKKDDDKKDDDKKDDGKKDDVKKDDVKKDDAAVKTVDPPPSPAAGSGDTAQKRERILKQIAADPSFLVNNRGDGSAALAKYKAYARCAHDQREKASDLLKEQNGKKRSIPDSYKDWPMFNEVWNALTIRVCKKEIDDLAATLPN